jgi:hypothetical protein
VDPSDGLQQPIRLAVLEQEAAGAGAQRAVDVLVELEHAEDEDATPGRPGVAEDAAGGLDPVAAGHADVHQDDVGAQFPREPHGLGTGSGLARDREPGRRLDQRAQAVPDERLVVGEEHPDGGPVHESSGMAATTLHP